MSLQLPSSLTASVSGVIKPGACVNIRAAETITVPEGAVGIIGIRQTLADKRLTLGATLLPTNWTGQPNVQFINHDEETIEIKAGDELANVAYLAKYVG